MLSTAPTWQIACEEDRRTKLRRRRFASHRRWSRTPERLCRRRYRIRRHPDYTHGGRLVNIREILGMAPVIPVLTLSDLAHAVPLARALVDGGLSVLEITLRTPVAIGCVEAIRKAVPDAIIG